MNELSIRIKICDRIYPMKIKREEEALIRESAKIINDKISKYKNQFGTNDNQDLLAITSFDSILELAKIKKIFEKQTIDIKSNISDIQEKISKVI